MNTTSTKQAEQIVAGDIIRHGNRLFEIEFADGEWMMVASEDIA